MLDAVRTLVRLGAIIAALVPFVATWNRREKPMRGTGRWSRRLVGLVLLLVVPARVAAQNAITNANIGGAATAWATNPTTAATTYGNIAEWNTAAVTTMANLFYPSSTAQPTFNADISKWNVAGVSNMYQVHPLCRALQTPRLVWRSLIGRHFSTALLGLGACSCRTRTCAWLPCLPTRCALLHRRATSMAWLGMGRLLPCRASLISGEYFAYSIVHKLFKCARGSDRRRLGGQRRSMRTSEPGTLRE
jgi:hypothetical protein